MAFRNDCISCHSSMERKEEQWEEGISVKVVLKGGLFREVVDNDFLKGFHCVVSHVIS